MAFCAVLARILDESPEDRNDRAQRPPGPVCDDVVVMRDRTADGHSYVVAVFPQPAQLRFLTLEAAADTAHRWAAASTVRVWFTADGLTFTPLTAGSGTAAGA